MKKLLLAALFLGGTLVFTNCGGGSNKNSQENATEQTTENNNTEQGTEQGAEEVDPMTDKGIGPVSSVELGDAIDQELAKKGEELFTSKGCNACHDINEKRVGPPLKGVTTRRTPEWIMNMILNPTEMTQKDPIAKKLLGEYAAPMSNQNLTKDEARAILEYFRNIDAQ